MEIISVGDPAAISAAKTAVEHGDCIVFPTDTVYGIAVRCDDSAATQRLFDAKSRGRHLPLPVLAAEIADLEKLAKFTEAAYLLADNFWPGPMTLILERIALLELGDNTETIAVRIPGHEVTRALLRATGPLAVSSANISGQPAALTVVEAAEQLNDKVALYLDGGTATGPIPSTIINLVTNQIIRPGRLNVDDIRHTHPDLSGVICASTC